MRPVAVSKMFSSRRETLSLLLDSLHLKVAFADPTGRQQRRQEKLLTSAFPSLEMASKRYQIEKGWDWEEGPSSLHPKSPSRGNLKWNSWVTHTRIASDCSRQHLFRRASEVPCHSVISCHLEVIARPGDKRRNLLRE